jgi:hypothetical protein
MWVVLCGLLAAWVLGRVVSDRWWWSQYVSWAPSAAVLGVCVGLAMLRWGLGRVRSRAPREKGLPRRLASVALGSILWGGIAYSAVFEYRLLNAVRGPAKAPSVRLLDWNVTSVERAEHLLPSLRSEAPDIAVLVNPNNWAKWPEVFEGMPEHRYRLNRDMIQVLSRYPIVRHGSLWLGLPEATDEHGAPATGARDDPGRALYFEVDTTDAIGRTLVVWVLDMPSDERLSRWDLSHRAAAAIAGWSGIETRSVEGGRQRARGGPGFPAPDVIIGDFNIPRGSKSLNVLTRGLTNAFDQAGWGLCATWPRARPVFHIDQTFVGPAVRATGYRVFDPGHGSHRGQVADIAPAK